MVLQLSSNFSAPDDADLRIDSRIDPRIDSAALPSFEAELLAKRLEKRRSRRGGSLDLARSRLSSLLDRGAAAARVDAAYLVVALGTVLFVYLNRAAKFLTMLSFDSPEADVAVARVLALAVFTLLQRIAGLEPGAWLRLRGVPPVDSGGPLDLLLDLPTPIAGVLLASLFVLPVAALSACGLKLLPVFGTGFPSEARALLTLVVAPLSEEVFFRAWLLSAFARNGGAANLAIIVSAGLYGLYVVPLSSVLNGTTGGDGPALLLLYEALGGFLAYLFQRSGGSLPLVVVTHCTFNLAVALLATQVPVLV